MSFMDSKEGWKRATGGRPSPAHGLATCVSIDTRTLAPGDLFVALKDVHAKRARTLSSWWRWTKVGRGCIVTHVPRGVRPKSGPLAWSCGARRMWLKALEAAWRSRACERSFHARLRGRSPCGRHAWQLPLGLEGTMPASAIFCGVRAVRMPLSTAYNNHWAVPLTLRAMPADNEYRRDRRSA